MAISLDIHNQTISVGDTIRVNYKIIEKEMVSGKTKKEKHEEQKVRTQGFEGIVIAIRGTGDGKSFIVRHQGVGGIGVERIFPVISPWIKSVSIKKKGRVRRAKLYYLRKKSGKEVARLGELVKENKTQPKAKEKTNTQQTEDHATKAAKPA